MSNLDFSNAMDFIGLSTYDHPIWSMIEPKDGSKIIGLDEFVIEYPELGFDLSFLDKNSDIRLSAIHFLLQYHLKRQRERKHFPACFRKECRFVQQKKK